MIHSYTFYLFIYLLFLAVLGLRFCARAFSSCRERGPLFIAVRGPLTVAASLVAEHGLQTRRLSRCGSRAQLLHGMGDLPRPGLEPVSPALAGRFSTTAPPRKPNRDILNIHKGGVFVSMSPDLSQVSLEAWHSLGCRIPTVEGSPQIPFRAVFSTSSGFQGS